MGHEELSFDDGGVSTVLETAVDEPVSQTYQRLSEIAKKAGLPEEHIDWAVQDYIRSHVNLNGNSQGELEKKTQKNLRARIGAAIGFGTGASAGILSLLFLDNDSALHLYGKSGMAYFFIASLTTLGYCLGTITDNIYTVIDFVSSKKKK